jgi:phosphatidylglycerophosphatase C
VEAAAVSQRTLGASELILELDSLRLANEPTAIVFDADGTLWAGDVGEDVFHFATARGLLREEARAELDRNAKRHSIASAADPNRTALSMFKAYLDGKYPELEICEMMTWCYAGFALEELSELVREALLATKLRERVRRELEPMLEYARTRGIRSTVVSASPSPIVAAAAGLLGFAAADVAASQPKIASGRILPELDGHVPYAKTKCDAARGLFGSSDWLASFGDNVFDIDMLCAARIGVAVHPKPALLARLPELASVVLLRDTPIEPPRV